MGFLKHYFYATALVKIMVTPGTLQKRWPMIKFVLESNYDIRC